MKRHSATSTGKTVNADASPIWATDANGPKGPNRKHDRGIFHCTPTELADPQKHTLLFNAEFEMANMIIEDGVILARALCPGIDL
ncbi:MAG TPA: hypothetical protein PK992_11875 [Planctomycetaceae bacterium]|nr:hypothetical protein [Planctomycetaceae bacterium]